MNKIPVYKSLFVTKLVLGIPFGLLMILLVVGIALSLIMKTLLPIAPILLIVFIINKKYREDSQYLSVLIKKSKFPNKIG